MNNNALYAIITYVIVMLIIIIIKPDFVYDHDKAKFKEFGSSKNKSFFSLGTTAILLAILIGILFIVFGNSYDDEKKDNETTKVQYITVPVYQQHPYMQQPMPQVIYQQMPQQMPITTNLQTQPAQVTQTTEVKQQQNIEQLIKA